MSSTEMNGACHWYLCLIVRDGANEDIKCHLQAPPELSSISSGVKQSVPARCTSLSTVYFFTHFLLYYVQYTVTANESCKGWYIRFIILNEPWHLPVIIYLDRTQRTVTAG